MNDKEINIAIAEACGWHDCGVIDGFAYGLRQNATSLKNRYEPIPDFCNDLNAMHEAEKVAQLNLMNANQWAEYGRLLMHLHPTSTLTVPVTDEEDMFYEISNIAHSTARQRAEAFLKTINN